MSSGDVSGGNSTAIALGAGESFTGTAEFLFMYASVTVMVYSDVDSAANGLAMQFSADGVNWDRAKSVTVVGGSSQAHALLTISKYFRVVYTNGSSAQSEFRLQTVYHRSRERALTSGTTQTLQTWDDVALERPASDFFLDASAGRIGYASTVQKFGSNNDVGTGAYEDIWQAGGTYNWLTAASAVRVKAGGNAADTAAGAGAQSVTIVGLDENWAEASETVATNGALASSPTTTTFIRVFRAYVENAGAYTGVNTGDVTIETTGGTTVGFISAGLGQSQLGLYSVPAGKVAYLQRFRIVANSGANKTATIRLWQRRDADDVATPFKPKRLVDVFNGVSGEVSVEHATYPSFPAKTDIWFDAIGDANATSVDVSFDLILVDA